MAAETRYFLHSDPQIEVTEFEIQVTIRGPATTVTTNYGDRTDRPSYAQLEMPVTPASAWAIYQHAIEQAIVPSVGIVLPEIDPASASRV